MESYKMLEGESPSQVFKPAGYKVRVNVMWFGSLVCSLVAALLSIQCKQWLDGYGVCYCLDFPAYCKVLTSSLCIG